MVHVHVVAGDDQDLDFRSRFCLREAVEFQEERARPARATIDRKRRMVGSFLWDVSRWEYLLGENLHASGRNCRVKHAERTTVTVSRTYLFNGSGKLPVILKILTTRTDNTGTSANLSPASCAIYALSRMQRSL